MTKTGLLVTVICSLCLIACGSSSKGSGSGGGNDAGSGPVTNDNCPSFAGSYTLTTQVVKTTCRLGLNVITQPIVYAFTQTAPSCTFTMTNSVYTGPIYAGHFSMEGDTARVTWDSVAPAPSAAGYALTYTSEDLTITPGVSPAPATIVGSFVWHSAAACDGTTNICNGAVPAGCPTPQ